MEKFSAHPRLWPSLCPGFLKASDISSRASLHKLKNTIIPKMIMISKMFSEIMEKRINSAQSIHSKEWVNNINISTSKKSVVFVC